ncbi:hypothetical protein ABGB14_13920 [Nonomuraea sp. B10E15]|uniref:hypothetical protein n=1 Tax=Nonomuraea sp. B10E15 TaxID=3153560 RepID=UPI00325CE585
MPGREPLRIGLDHVRTVLLRLLPQLRLAVLVRVLDLAGARIGELGRVEFLVEQLFTPQPAVEVSGWRGRRDVAHVLDREKNVAELGGPLEDDGVREICEPEHLRVPEDVSYRHPAGGRQIAEELHQTRGGVDQEGVAGPRLLLAHAASLLRLVPARSEVKGFEGLGRQLRGAGPRRARHASLPGDRLAQAMVMAVRVREWSDLILKSVCDVILCVDAVNAKHIPNSTIDVYSTPVDA